MGKFSFSAASEKVRRKVSETLEGTVIHRRQQELAIGRWDFVVFGAGEKKGSVITRVCVAEQAIIEKAHTYIASVGDPAKVGRSGVMSIEEIAGGDIPDSLVGLDIYHMSPFRPIEILSLRKTRGLDCSRDLLFEEFGDKNIAIIETPDEAAWSVSALKYLDECDTFFPDPVMSHLRMNIRAKEADRGPSGRYH